MPKYITWDNVIDIFLSNTFSASVINNPKLNKGASPIVSHDIYPAP